MLDQETKRKIDNARDILVGKVPDPKSQVEQITIALIYKFMDDMDKDSEGLGGKATFFTGEFEKYAWPKIVDTKIGGQERLNLYAEAIAQMNHNKNIPQLFRDIFKNAFLPYRDPETLKMFLKIINEFHYDHSEKLGDAFEYLLSVLGSQGDAGQFRTPRHIIDFMVAIMQPKKEESICDPACGTAGFLISSYKHILNENTKKNKGDLLTPDDRKKLINNFVGYDISAEMVRLSLVNLYLHGFATPKIYEYDTLTSEDRWGDYFDIILANPPFMTPKGGIRPHKKFAMQANRSEVLFVDYIMEHINPTTGRAAIIVPEGIIFQSATAYKALRELLVEKNFLYGVVSLPAGVFLPYSGVKTSILLLDKSLAKKTDKIIFLKIKNDGFDLGAQRKPINGSELEEAISLISKFHHAVKEQKTNELSTSESPLDFTLLEKSIIAESDDFNLASDRYKAAIKHHKSQFEKVKLGDLCDLQNGYAFKSDDYIDSSNTLNFRMSNIRPDGQLDINYSAKYLPDEYAHSFKDYLLNDGDVVIAMTDMASDPKILGLPTIIVKDDRNLLLNQRVGRFTNINENRLHIPYLRYVLSSDKVKNYFKSLGGGGLQINIGKKDILNLEIPLPSIELQKNITVQIEEQRSKINKLKEEILNIEKDIRIFVNNIWD